jgi:hypothetical protein
MPKSRAIRADTINRHLKAYKDLREQLSVDPKINNKAFTQKHRVSAGFIGELCREEYLSHIGVSAYSPTNKILTADGLRDLLRKREGKRHLDPNRTSNDPGPSEDPKAIAEQIRPSAFVPLADYEALERRVSALEQLIIRKGVA